MTEYVPLSLTPLCNTSFHEMGIKEPMPRREQTYHGLPFLLGDKEGKVAGFGDGVHLDPVTIPVERDITYAIFAHRLVDSGILQGGTPVGVPCADYFFIYSDGTEERSAVRDRFEIGVIPTAWGQWPFLAKPDQKDSLFPRREGSFDMAGHRQTEVRGGTPRSFYLWYWCNNRPDQKVSAIRIEPRGPRFVVGGITLSHLDEEPFTRAAKEPVVITLDDATATGGEGEVEVEIATAA